MKFFVILITCLMFYSINTKAQVDCPDLNNFISAHTQFEPYPFEWLASPEVDYQYKQTGANTYDIHIDWSTFDENNKFYRFNKNNWKELYIQAIIFDLFDNCENLETKIINFYEYKPCYKILSCYIKVDQTNSVYCYNQDWVGGEPEWFNYQGTKYYQVKEKQDCGIACCKTTFTLECEEVIAHGGGPNRWKVLSKTYTSLGCDVSTTFDCLTNQLLPCEVDCE